MGQGGSILAGLKRDDFSFAKEMQDTNFGDQRLTDRLVVTLDNLYKHPSLPVTGACENKAQAKAAYRLMNNEKVEREAILRAHQEQTILRMGNYPIVFSVQDTSTLNYATHLATEGLGQIGRGGGSTGRGLFLHTTKVFSASGLPLGILDQIQWAREEGGKSSDHPLPGDESDRWLLSLDEIAQAQSKLPNTKVVVLSDRESDFNDYLFTAKKAGLTVVLRAKSNMRVDDNKTFLKERVSETKLLGNIALKIKQKKGPKRWQKRDKSQSDKKHRPQESREAHLEVRAAEVVLRASPGTLFKKATVKERTFWAVWVNEINPPAEYEAVEWLLLTNEDLSPDPARKSFEIIEWYKMRWGIESFHKILKSGCRIESAQYDHTERLAKFIAMMSLVAWRLHMLVHAQREAPDEPCTAVLTSVESKVLYMKVNKTNQLPKAPPTLRQATRWIAGLGGFLGRKGDGEPGSVTLWRGWQRLKDLADGYTVIMQAIDVPQNYG